jgi:hypothetical protein
VKKEMKFTGKAERASHGEDSTQLASGTGLETRFWLIGIDAIEPAERQFGIPVSICWGQADRAFASGQTGWHWLCHGPERE